MRVLPHNPSGWLICELEQDAQIVRSVQAAIRAIEDTLRVAATQQGAGTRSDARPLPAFLLYCAAVMTKLNVAGEATIFASTESCAVIVMV
jgi:hypothetical protein